MPFFKIGTITALFHCVRKCSRDRLRTKIYLSSGVNIVEQPFVIKPRSQSTPTDLEGLRCCTAFKMSNLEMAGNCNKSLEIDKSDNPTENHIINRLKFFTKIPYTSTGLTASVPFTSS